uniref:FYN binding protein 1 n=1 Tax=Coturnix japonica TaxID=93934 RepID=A0A8C2T8P4_COTJA
MAKFNVGNNPSEDVSGNIRLSKVTGQPTHSGLQTRKAVFEKFASQGNAASSSGSSVSQKPAHSKPPLAVKPSTEDKTEKDPKPPYLKPVGQKFGVQLQATNRESDGKAGYTKAPTKSSDMAKEETKPLYPKPAGNKPLNSAPQEKEKKPLGTKPNFNSEAQESEEKTSFSKVAGVKEKFMSATQENDSKPSFSKPALAQKPSVNHAVSHNEDTSSKNVSPHKGLAGPRPNIHSFKARKETDENSNCAAETASSHFSNMALKPTGHWSSASQVTPKNAEEKTEEKGVSATRNIFLNKIIQEESGLSPPRFPKTSTTFATGRSLGGSDEKDDLDRSSGAPKRKSLPPLFKLGPPPQKPSRPPSVDLERFQKSIPRDSAKNEGFKQMAPTPAAASLSAPPPPPASHPSLNAPAAPSLPPRNVKPSSETINPDTEENYDDVEFLLQGRMETFTKTCTVVNSRTSREKEKKSEKEEKRRLDQEKKEQKEKEKKEQEIRKKFKLTGPIQVLHQARACIDSKGGKNELTVKQGDQIEIIRLTDNPEGKWLGRIKGCYGYIKTTVVEIDYDSLKTKQQAVVKQPEIDQEVYDDIGEQDSISSQSGGRNGAGKMFPPPPSDQEIYDGVDDTDAAPRSVSQDEDKNDIWSWRILKKLKIKDCKKKSVREKTTKVNGAEDNGNLFVYDDVDSSDFPPPPPEFNLSKSVSLAKGKSDEKNPQKLKMMEREEKEFRKKFKFEGEIKVLYSTTTVQDLSQRKWGSKDLQIKPGEPLEVIQSTDDTKVLCRNEEGKCNDGEIYDDVAEGMLSIPIIIIIY